MIKEIVKLYDRDDDLISKKLRIVTKWASQ